MSANPEDRDIVPRHDPFDAPDAEDEADTRQRVLEGGEDAGDGDAERVRRELERSEGAGRKEHG
jgi:hypothetical protein